MRIKDLITHEYLNVLLFNQIPLELAINENVWKMMYMLIITFNATTQLSIPSHIKKYGSVET